MPAETMISILAATLLATGWALWVLPVGTCAQCAHCRAEKVAKARESEAQMSQVPHTPVSITPNMRPSYSRKGMASICTVVLTLPIMCTATLLLAPICAIHSRSAEIAISRPMMIAATPELTRPSSSNITSATQTSSLSATGSRKAPKAVCWPSRRAR